MALDSAKMYIMYCARLLPGCGEGRAERAPLLWPISTKKKRLESNPPNKSRAKDAAKYQDTECRSLALLSITREWGEVLRLKVQRESERKKRAAQRPQFIVMNASIILML